MTDNSGLIADLKDNFDVEYWGGLLDKFDARLAELHKNIDGEKYSEWGLLALKAFQGDAEAKAAMNEMFKADDETKKSMDEMALLYLTQPIMRHYMFRASNRAQEQGPPSGP